MADPTRTRAADAAVTSHAEVGEVWVRDDRITVDGAVATPRAASPGSAALVACARDHGVEVVGPTTLDADRFSAALDLSALVRSGAPAQTTWDLYLRIEGIGDLRLGRHLDDIPEKKEKLVYPFATVGGGAAKQSVEPYYTVQNNLSIRPHALRSPPKRRAGADVEREKASAGRRLRRHQQLLLPLASSVRRGALGAVRLSAGRRRPTAKEPVPAPTERMKIYFLIINVYGMGGTIRTVLNLAGFLARDYDVEVISVVRRRKRPFFEFPAGVKVTYLDDQMVKRPFPRGPLVAFLRAIPSVLVYPEDHSYRGSSLWRDYVLVRKLRSLRTGVLITTRPALNLLAAELAPPGLVTVGQEHLNLGTYKPGLAGEIAHRYPKLDAVGVLTEEDLSEYANVLARDSTRVVHIPNAVPRLHGGSSTLSSPLVVAAGRLTPQKGFDLLIEAFAHVVERHSDWRLHIYGSGEKLEELRKLIFERELYNNVFLMGRARELGREFERASVFALSSRFEGLPMVLLEAMSKRLPVVSFDCPTGPRQVVTHGHDGLLVPNGDIGAFAMSLLELIEDASKRRRMGDAALETAGRYDIQVVGHQWAELLRELTGAAPGVGPIEVNGAGVGRRENVSLTTSER